MNNYVMENKIIYGIDLGTTNSSISRFDGGCATVLLSKTLNQTLPSCVAYSDDGYILVGDKARANLEKDYIRSYNNPQHSFNSFIEFKRQMGKDVEYYSSIVNRFFTPEQLSAEVLKALRQTEAKKDVRTAIITVPAIFDNNQKDATMRAAKLAGFDYVELIQEPVAASIAYGINAPKDAKWMVFDLGGGTFDAALMQKKDGVFIPLDTTGCNSLGGKDIDTAIIDGLIIPYLASVYKIDNILKKNPQQFRSMWKAKVEEAKIKLSKIEKIIIETDLGEDYGVDDYGSKIELRLPISRAQLDTFQKPVFQKAIEMAKRLLDRNNIPGNQLSSIILVGGPTYSPTLRKMIAEQLGAPVNTSLDPMTCVSQGAAIYGSTVSIPQEVLDKTRDRSRIQLDIQVKSSSLELEEYAAVKLLRSKCDFVDAHWVLVEFVRQDGISSSGAIKIDQDGEVVKLPLKPDFANIFDIKCYDELGRSYKCEPSKITILQGIDGIGDAIMPLTLGLGVNSENDEEVFKPIEGFLKGVKLPATGVLRGLLTRRDIRVGNANDQVRMSLYQKEEYDAMKTRTILCTHLYDVVINGKDVSSDVPAGCEVNLRLHADKSGRIDSFIVDIPYLDFEIDVTERITETKQHVMPLSIVNQEISSALAKIRYIPGLKDIENELKFIGKQYKLNEGNREIHDKLFSRLVELSEKVDDYYRKGEWQRAHELVKGIFDTYQSDVLRYGNESDKATFRQVKESYEKVISVKNVAHARMLYDQIWLLDFKLARLNYYTAWLYSWKKQFNEHSWTDASLAKRLVDEGITMLGDENTIPDVDVIAKMVDRICDLLPVYERPNKDTLQG